MRSALTDELVVLDRDHPGFRDPVYRQRRNEIAQQALQWREGEPLPEVRYTEEEHQVWRIVLEHLGPLHQRMACPEFLECWPKVAFPTHRVPTFAEVNALLGKTTGVALRPAAGLVTPRMFLQSLGEGVFWATQYLRHPSTPLYTPEPDSIHELIGHAVLLAHPDFARLHQLFGAAARVSSDAVLEELIRVYWYTVEFGLVRDGKGVRAVGAGLLSSAGELARIERAPELRPFDLEAAATTPYDPTDYQPVLFVAESTQALLGTLSRWLEGLARR